MPKCTFLIGVPASGKSTWASAQNVDTISTDNIIEDIATRFDLSYDQAFKDLIGFAEKVFISDIIAFAERGEDMYIDRTNLSVKSRKRIMDLVRSHNYTFDAVVFPTPDPMTWESRLSSRPGKTIPQNVLNSMKATFVMPTEDEGFTKIIVI